MLEQTTTSTIREMRALLLELRPTRLEQLSLTEALTELATAYSTRLGIQVNSNLAHVQLQSRSEQTLLRIAQEALANSARHMQERVQELHGTFKLESTPDQGTSLEIRLPLEEEL
jgi:signal transduction histidine kinase